MKVLALTTAKPACVLHSEHQEPVRSVPALFRENVLLLDLSSLSVDNFTKEKISGHLHRQVEVIGHIILVKTWQVFRRAQRDQFSLAELLVGSAPEQYEGEQDGS